MAKNTHKHFTDEDKALIARSTNTKAAKMLGRTEQSISGARHRFGLPKYVKTNKRGPYKKQKTVTTQPNDFLQDAINKVREPQKHTLIRTINNESNPANWVKAFKEGGATAIIVYPDGRLVGHFN